MTTFVLIHGASQGGWIWQPTAARLRGAGHLVYAPSLDGCGERRHGLRPGITVAIVKASGTGSDRTARVAVGSYLSRAGLPRHLLVDWTFRPITGGPETSMTMHHHWQLQDGKVVRFRGSEDSALTAQAFAARA